MPKLRDETREERRQALIDAGWRCLALQGFRDLTVDDVCSEAGASKGAFYGYFSNKQELLLELLRDDAAELDLELERLSARASSGIERLRGFTRAMLSRGEDAARVQVRADLWAELLTEASVREQLAAVARRRREIVRGWIEESVASGEMAEIPANALASILLALADGLMLHGALDRDAFRWRNIRRALDVLLGGIEIGVSQA